MNPDFYKLVPWEGDGYKPVGYGFESVAASQLQWHAGSKIKCGHDPANALKKREMIADATERNYSYLQTVL
jgi:hypothetical protein